MRVFEWLKLIKKTRSESEFMMIISSSTDLEYLYDRFEYEHAEELRSLRPNVGNLEADR